ncbi:MAG: tRNA (adenosine(37)-N6)-threonylcarbamoyltransferase complex transferase subunit TsaD [Actinomycetota bacterium]|nr:tRNA (adenosine(37)-N6)-threonylcarbamoyltransferase complex transferase subunit TsaD [Actinomycetota bacterium]
MSQKPLIILAIETSCDETAAAVLKGGTEILSNVISSQVEWHAKFSGVVPEIASRKHVELIGPVIEEALLKADIKLQDVDAIAVTHGPGLVGALLVGLGVAKGLAYGAKKPLICVNHIEAHILANFLENPDLQPPLVALVVSGGHTALIYMEDFGKYEIMGETLDDAAGEAFDKVAKFMELGYPGGPIIDRLAKEGDPTAIDFPRAMMKSKNYDFSLSGLKTAVINYVRGERAKGHKINLNDLAASFQAAIIDVQIDKSIRAAKEKNVKSLVLAGGVSANRTLRERMGQAAAKEGIKAYHSSLALCTDNAAMVAKAAYQMILKDPSLLDVSAGRNMDANAYPILDLCQHS